MTGHHPLIKATVFACSFAVFANIAAPEFLVAAPSPDWTWTNLTPSQGPAPEPRHNGTAIYDPADRRLIIFGGFGESEFMNDVWAFDLSTLSWSQLDALGNLPEPRLGDNAIYDPVAHQMIIWAGQQGSVFFNDTWALDLATLQWHDVSPSTRPAARYGAAAVFDPVQRRLVQFAGFTQAGRFQDTQAFDLATLSWQDLTPPGNSPEERCLHTAAYHPASQQMIVYGGQRIGLLDDLWAFDLDSRSWTEITPAERPPGRRFASSFVDEEGSFIVFGGGTTTGNVNETWAFSFSTEQWTLLDLEGPPSARNGMMGAYIAEEDRFVIFGGVGASLHNDVWELKRITESITHQAYFAQFANGSDFVSSVVVTNPSQTEETSGSVSFFDDLGQPLAVPLNGQPESSSVSFAISPLGGVTLTTDGGGPLVTGSAQLTSSGPIGGVLRFTFPGLGVAGVGASAPISGFIAPVSRSAARKLNTGIAVAAQDSSVKLTLTLRDSQGQPVAEGESVWEIPANGHLARFIDELFPNAESAEFKGTLTASVEGGTVAATVIELGSEPGEFTVLSVTPLN